MAFANTCHSTASREEGHGTLLILRFPVRRNAPDHADALQLPAPPLFSEYAVRTEFHFDAFRSHDAQTVVTLVVWPLLGWTAPDGISVPE
jgi:hypothetical protein